MSDDDKKVVGLFGQRVTPTGKTSDGIHGRLDSAKVLCGDRKIVAFGGVCIDEDGMMWCFFAHDSGKSGLLIGGVTYLQSKLCEEHDQDMELVTPPEKPPEGESA